MPSVSGRTTSARCEQLEPSRKITRLKDKPSECTFCGKPAEHQYTLAKRTVEICATCLVRQRLQDVYEAALPELDKLATAGNFSDAQRILDAMLSVYVQQDTDGWLKRSIISHKALLYMMAGSHSQALLEYQALKQLGFAGPSERVEYGLGISRALLAGGRAPEAISVLEEALDGLDSCTLPSGIPLLEALGQSHAALGIPLPERWRVVLRSAAAAAGIELPDGAQDMTLHDLVLFSADALRSRLLRGS